ncbi:hypothetical protein NL108_016511 [Boleophthalmus pectinirostris]|nr:hypothetical protein NL108_016511 [Boleophthalmus pectinirostris]
MSEEHVLKPAPGFSTSTHTPDPHLPGLNHTVFHFSVKYRQISHKSHRRQGENHLLLSSSSLSAQETLVSHQSHCNLLLLSQTPSNETQIKLLPAHTPEAVALELLLCNDTALGGTTCMSVAECAAASYHGDAMHT